MQGPWVGLKASSDRVELRSIPGHVGRFDLDSDRNQARGAGFGQGLEGRAGVGATRGCPGEQRSLGDDSVHRGEHELGHLARHVGGVDRLNGVYTQLRLIDVRRIGNNPRFVGGILERL